MDSLPAKIMNEVKLLLRDGSNVSSSFSFFFLLFGRIVVARLFDSMDSRRDD